MNRRVVALSLGFLTALELGSWISQWFPQWSLALLIACTAGVFLATLRSTSYGLAAIALELLIGSHGHMIGLGLKGEGGLALRMTMFAAVMLAWMINVVRKRDVLVLPAKRLGLAVAAVLYAVFVAFARGRGFGEVLSDANGYAFLALLLPVLSWYRTGDRESATALLGAGLIWAAAKTLILVYVFSHLSEPVLRMMYVWIRDTRVGEITKFVTPIYRIFLPSQLFLVFGAVFLLVGAHDQAPSRTRYAMIGFLMAGLIASLSRSFALALVLTMFIAIAWRRSMRLFLQSLAVGVLGVLIFGLVVKFPVPEPSASDLTTLLVSRYGSASDPAASARWALLGPLWNEIKTAPITGHGFAKEVSYVSPDPFWLDIRPDGLVTTTRFEWGWLDVWLKFGLLGGGLFVAYLVMLGKRLPQRELLVFIALLITHATTPFLDHPLGLGVIVALEAIASFREVATVSATEG